MKLSKIIETIEHWIPPAVAESYDNVGLQIGRPDTEVSKGLVALDLTPAVLDEALEWGAELIVTHHPLLFSPLRSITPDTFTGDLVYRSIQRGIAVYAMHTNLDAVSGGVSFELARKLGLDTIRPLTALESRLYKLVTFVPAEHAEQVRAALGGSGAGQIGAYSDCAFESSGTGFFKPLASADPYVGSVGGELEKVSEVRLEVQVTRWDLGRVLAVLKAAHPYEEVAYDVYPLEQGHTRFGFGAIGSLARPESLGSFLNRTGAALKQPAPRYAGNLENPVKRVAVCGGAGRDLIGQAQKQGADVFVTGDLSYHNYFAVLNRQGKPAMALVDAGHYETEAPSQDLMARELTVRIPSVTWQKTRSVTSPIRCYQTSFPS